MRPPSYYSSLASSSSNYGTSHNNSSNLSRSSFSSPSSSTYATRSHLPYVPSSMLVAHCISGTNHSSLKPSNYQSTAGYSTSYSRPKSQKRYTSTTPSSISSYSSSYHSSRVPHSNYISSSSASGSYISSVPRSSYLSSQTTGSTRTSYRPSAVTSSSAAYNYKPIRLRDRPLLTQISRYVNTPTTTTTTTTASSRSSRIHSESFRKKQEVPGAVTSEPTDESRWSSDVGRNISRNKYLIKFREIDKRKGSTIEPIQLTNRIRREPSVERESVRSVEPVPDREVEPEKEPAVQVVDTVELIETKPLVDAHPKEEDQQEMKLEPTIVATITSKGPAKSDCTESQQQEEQPEMKSESKVMESSEMRENVGPKVSKTTARTPKSSAEKKPKERRNVKLKIGAMGSSTETSMDQPGEATKQSGDSKVDDSEIDATVKRKVVKKPGKVVATPSSPVVMVKPAKEKESSNSSATTEQKSPLKQIQPEVNNETSTRPRKIKTSKTIAKSESANAKPIASVDVTDKNTVVTTPPSQAGSKRIRFREYNLDDFNFLSVLGHGGWGFVILAELKGHDSCFAVKCIKKITIVEDDDFDSIMIERKVLTLGNLHPFICKLFCTFETEGYLFFAMEYCAGGDLMFHVQKEGKFSEERCRFYAAEIICAIRFLHNRHIIYRDLKLDNILLDSAGHVRLVDFGMCQCRTYREEMLPSNFCGTPEYISPEIIKGVPYNHSVDWWSFGVLLYEMAVGKMPFRGGDENELLWNVCYEQIHYPMFLSKELTSLLQLLLEREPTKRMGMATCKAGDIYDQAWFRGVDWPAVETLRVKPPFVPEVNSNRDVQNFDADFTESRAELSPVDEATLQRIDQEQFHSFPYTNPDIYQIFDTS